MTRLADQIVRGAFAAVEPIAVTPAAAAVTVGLVGAVLAGIGLHVRAYRRRWRCTRAGCRNPRLPGSRTCAAHHRRLP
ncbi:MAG: hypothetical protein F4X35_03070 [Alphaproteobacteria bacterium]|nr:hypothetical protein [Alphaproteobacteria bacterium]